MQAVTQALIELKLGVWLNLCIFMTALLLALVLIRITVPRFKLETLSRLG